MSKSDFDDLVIAIGEQSDPNELDRMSGYFDRTLGKLRHVSNQDIWNLERGEDHEYTTGSLEADEFEEARDVHENPNRFVRLPHQNDFEAWDLRNEFCNTLDEDSASKLKSALQGKGAFGRFKGMLFELGLDGAWFDFEEDIVNSIARMFCKENSIAIA